MVFYLELCVKMEVHSEFSVNQDSPTGSGLWRMITGKQCLLKHESNRSPYTLFDPTSHTNCSLPSVPILCPFLIIWLFSKQHLSVSYSQLCHICLELLRELNSAGLMSNGTDAFIASSTDVSTSSSSFCVVSLCICLLVLVYHDY